MKKLTILALFLSLFVLGGVFGSTVQAATFKNSVLSFQYPDEWQVPEDKKNTAFVAVSTRTVNNFNANMNVVISGSDPTFKDITVEDFKQEYAAGLERSGIKNVKFIKAEKNTWQDAPGMYIEYEANFSNIPIRYVQTFRDDGKNLVILTFVASQNDWNVFGKQVNDVVKSANFI